MDRAGAVRLWFFTLIPLLVSSQPSFNYDDFSNLPKNEFLESGRAKIEQGMLRLSDNNTASYGRVMKRELMNFCDENPLSFTTDFTFTITSRDRIQNADGLAFLISPNIQAPSADSYGRWLSLVEPTDNGKATNRLVAVEFDTYRNVPPDWPEFQDINANHVGININQLISANSTSLGPYDIVLGSSNPVAARVVYNASLQRLTVYVSKDVSFKNVGSPVLEYSVNLCAYVGTASFIGFSAGTGTANVDFHDIRSWRFRSSFAS